MEVRLSKNEKRLYGYITRACRSGGRISTDELTKRFYNNVVPINGRVYVANMLRSLKRKCSLVDGMRCIESTEGSGRKALEVWLAEDEVSAA